MRAHIGWEAVESLSHTFSKSFKEVGLHVPVASNFQFQIVAFQVSNGTPGGGNMPAYGKQISPAEMTALVTFLEDLRPAGAPSAEPATRPTGGKEYP